MLDDIVKKISLLIFNKFFPVITLYQHSLKKYQYTLVNLVYEVIDLVLGKIFSDPKSLRSDSAILFEQKSYKRINYNRVYQGKEA